jgi:DNA invertase Pin-like site-specific DNA recombinase
MKIAYSYVRFSTPEQKKGRSGNRQVEKFSEWCKEFGYTASPNTFRDEGRSAYRGKHLEGEGDLKRFLSLIEDRTIKPGAVLVVENFDRFSRLPTVRAVKLFLDVITSGIGMAFTMTSDKRPITEEILNREDHLLYVIVGEAKRAHSESKYKGERVADGCKDRRERAKHGQAMFVWTPPWCDFDRAKGYSVNKEKAALVKRVFAEYLK